jgi:tetratricopeptide (TPR) repeat protein
VRGVSFWLLLTIVLLLSGAARAEENPGKASDAERARELFTRGAQAYRQGRFDEAISLFQAGDRLAPRAEFSYNLAVAFEARGEVARALEHYRTYLRRGPKQGERPAVLAEIRRHEAALEQRGIQQVTVLTRPVATLIIDGQEVGTSPWTGELVPGAHALVVRPAGADPFETEFDLPPHRAVDLRVDVPGPESSSIERPLAWTFVGVASAAVVATTVLGVIALDRKGTLDAVCGPSEDACPPGSEGDIATFRTTRALSYVSLGVAVASTAGALVLFTRGDASAPKTEIAVQPYDPLHRGSFVALRSTF